MKRYLNSKNTSFAMSLLLFSILVAILSIGKATIAQQSSHPEGKEGGIDVSKKLGFPQSSPIKAASPNAPTLSKQQRAFLSNNTEETFKKVITPFTNKSIAPPPNDTHTQTNLSNTISTANKNIINHTSATLSSSDGLFFHNIASQPIPLEFAKKFRIFENKTVLPQSKDDNSNVSFHLRNEPSVASNGRVIFYVGNWYAARSLDDGSTWKFSIIRSTDQDVIYDEQHHIFIWYRQGFNDDSGQNKFTISVSGDALNWQTYTVSPTTIFGPEWKYKWFDFPHLALTRNSLYIATNLMESAAEFNNFNRTFIARISLDDLATGNNPSFTYFFSEKVFGFAPVQGATDVMYWAAHLTNDRMVVYKWKESEPASKVIRVEKSIPAWTPSELSYSCPTFDNDYCANADDRINAGWISHGIIGFVWNVDKGGGFPWPYVDAATFRANDTEYLGRPLLWSKDFAWQYAFVSPDSKGNLGMVATFGGNKTNPSVAVGISGSNDTVPRWKIVPIIIGGKPEGFSDEWGDYLRVRAYNNNNSSDGSTKFIASGYTVEGTGNNKHIEPRLIVFGYTG
jgi:hypothetical protein